MPEREPPPDRAALSDEKERLRAVEDVLRDQARREVLREVAYRAPGPSLPARIAAGALALAAFIVWVVPFPGLQPAIPPLPPEAEAAGLRLATWVQAQQVEDFRLRRGRLPDVLREAGESVPGLSYERLDARTYRLQAQTERVTFTWTSSETTDTLADAQARLKGLR